MCGVGGKPALSITSNVHITDFISYWEISHEIPCLIFSYLLLITLQRRRKWQPTPVFFPGESQGQGSLWAAVYGVHRVGHNWSDLAAAAAATAVGTSQSLSHWRISHRPLGSQVAFWRERSVSDSALCSTVTWKWSSGHGRKLNKYLSLWWKKEWIQKNSWDFWNQGRTGISRWPQETGGIWLGEA